MQKIDDKVGDSKLLMKKKSKGKKERKMEIDSQINPNFGLRTITCANTIKQAVLLQLISWKNVMPFLLENFVLAILMLFRKKPVQRSQEELMKKYVFLYHDSLAVSKG